MHKSETNICDFASFYFCGFHGTIHVANNVRELLNDEPRSDKE